MEKYLEEALGIVKAQASVRQMTDVEIISMVQAVACGIKQVSEGETAMEAAAPAPAVDPKKAIREKTIICLECGKKFKVLTKRHLAIHGLTPKEYRERWGYSQKTPLIAKGLARDRRNKMKEMKLWERRGKNK